MRFGRGGAARQHANELRVLTSPHLVFDTAFNHHNISAVVGAHLFANLTIHFAGQNPEYLLVRWRCALAWQAALALAQTIISYLPTRVRWENMSVTFSCSMYCRDKKGNGLMRQFLRMIHTGSANWSGAPSPSWHQTLLVCRY